MKKHLLTAAVAFAAIGLASFQLIPNKPLAMQTLSSISPFEMMLAQSSLPTAEGVDAH
jgi:hypothetical protein